MWVTVTFFLMSLLLSAAVLFAPERVVPLLSPVRSPSSHQPAARLRAAAACWVRATQVLFTIALCYEIVIVVLYWSLLSPQFHSPRGWAKDVNAHAIMMCGVAGDLLVGSGRLLDRHSLVLLAATLIYLVWNVGITFTDAALYPVLQWDGAGSAILAVGAVLFAQAVFFFVGLVAIARDALTRRINATPSQDPAACCAGHAPAGDVEGGAAKTASEASAPSPTSSSSSPASSSSYSYWASIYPTSFTDDASAYPCHTCPCCTCCRACLPSASSEEASSPTASAEGGLVLRTTGTGTGSAEDGATTGADK
jgi:hypothetical protein